MTLITSCSHESENDNFWIGGDETFVNVFSSSMVETVHKIKCGDTITITSELPFMVESVITSTETKKIYQGDYNLPYKYQEETVDWLTIKHTTANTLTIIAEKSFEHSGKDTRIMVCTTLAEYDMPEKGIILSSNNILTFDIYRP